MPEDKEQPQETQRKYSIFQLFYDHEFSETTCHKYGDQIVDRPRIRNDNYLKHSQNEAQEDGQSDDADVVIEKNGENVDKVDTAAEECKGHDKPEGDFEVIIDIGLDVDSDEEENSVDDGEEKVEGPRSKPAVLDVMGDHQQK